MKVQRNKSLHVELFPQSQRSAEEPGVGAGGRVSLRIPAKDRPFPESPPWQLGTLILSGPERTKPTVFSKFFTACVQSSCERCGKSSYTNGSESVEVGE